jgi:hypothetical protein
MFIVCEKQMLVAAIMDRMANRLFIVKNILSKSTKVNSYLLYRIWFVIFVKKKRHLMFKPLF